MKKYGGFIPGIRAGKPTESYLAFVLSRLTLPGSLYLGLIALLPSVAFIFLNANQNFPFGGTSILIIVGVGLDTVKQIESLSCSNATTKGSSADAPPHHGPAGGGQGYAGRADRGALRRSRPSRPATSSGR